MKRLLVILLCVFSVISIFAQPKSILYKKENDFFMNVIYNPDMSLYKFLVVGLSSKNTELRDLNIYVNSKIVQDKCRELNVSISESYYKIKVSWKVLLEIENMDLSYDGFGRYMIETHSHNIFTPRTCPNPELKHKLSIVPLKLEEY